MLILHLSVNAVRWALKISILAAIVAVSLFFANSQLIVAEPIIATAVTIDLILTLPVAYYFFIRNSAIPRITVVPVFLAAVLLASFILPSDDRILLGLAVAYAVPAAELFVLGYLGYRVYLTRRAFGKLARTGRDLMERLRMAFVSELKPAVVARAAAFEIGVFFLILFVWQRPSTAGFSYHRNNCAIPILIVLLFLLIAETIVAHFLLAMFSPIAAWIATGVSIYLAIQVIAHFKALFMRPIVVTEDAVLLRCGIMGDAFIERGSIARVGKLSRFPQNTTNEIAISPLGSLVQPNVRIEMKQVTAFYSIYGLKKEYSAISFSVDEPDRFLALLEQRSH